MGFISLGCPKNLVDSEVMMGMLHASGAELTNHAADAEILVVNTCSFIDSAKQESVNTILEMVQHKTANGGRAQKLIVAGCLVERYRDEIRKNIPEVDAVVGTGELEQILAAAGLQAKPQASVDCRLALPHPDRGRAERIRIRYAGINCARALRRPHALSPRRRPARADRAFFSRALGRRHRLAAELPLQRRDAAHPHHAEIVCLHQDRRRLRPSCGFCIIPQLRGKFRSRRFASVIAEAESLVKQGVREITLIGQDTTCYGEDLPPSLATNPGAPSSPAASSSAKVGSQDAQGSLRRPDLADLLDALAQIEGVRWLRFLYAYPNKVTTKLLETIARHDNICKYLDVPLQHASPSVLKAMKRGGSGDIFLRMIEKARSIVPDIVLRTSFIVGFPGETEADYKQLEDFVRAAQLDWLGVFTYSDEEGSPAFDLPAKVPQRTIDARRRKLMKLQQSISRKKQTKWIDREFDLLVEGESAETELLWEGRTMMHAPEIDGKVFINDFGPHETLVPGTFYRCEITESHDYDVVARIIE